MNTGRLGVFASVFLSLACLGGAGAATVADAPAASDARTVHVTLLDMASIMGRGMGPGFGPGFGPGSDRGYGGGMTGQGPGQGRAPGMQGQGMQGPGAGPGNWRGMMGRGMMGGGMGMMSLLTDRSTVRSGKVHFAVTNASTLMRHEMLVIAVDDPNALLPYDYYTAKVPEDKVASPGEVSELEAGKSGTLDVELKPGSYLLICNIPGHYAAGMAALLTVTP